MTENAYSKINRSLGFIEGITQTCEQLVFDGVCAAIADIDEVLAEENSDNKVHAYWNKDPATGFTNCSNCKAPPPGDADLEKFYESDFCPCCGAVMDKKPIPTTSTG